MKKFLIVIASALLSCAVFAQKGYEDFETLGNIVVKTKIAHLNSKDDKSPLELSLYFQNVGTTEQTVTFTIHITDGNEVRYSTIKNVKVRPNQKQYGKISGLNYELIGTDISAYESGDCKWAFSRLEVSEGDAVVAKSSKIVDPKNW